MRKTFLFITTLLLLAGCANEQFVDERCYSGSVTVVSATFEPLSGNGTKATVTDAGTFTWQNGDKAAFTAAAESPYYIGTNSKDDNTAMFTINGGPFSSGSFAFYPSDLTTDKSTSSYDVNVPATRIWTNSQTNVAMYGVKVEDKGCFNFTHMGGLVRVKVYNVPTNARKFVFMTPGFKINGNFDVVDDGGYKVIKTASSNTESEQTDTLTWTTAPADENTMDFYIPLPLGTYTKGFAFKLLDEENAELISKSASQSETIARRDFVLMPSITLMGGEIEPAVKPAVVANIPAGYSGDFPLPQSEKVLLKINAGSDAENKDINLKYIGGNLPAELEIQVVGDRSFSKKLSGDLPQTHVEFTKGEIANVEMTTSASTFEIVYPAIITGKLTVTGGNVKVRSDVGTIEVAKNAVADAETNAPVQVVLEKYNGDVSPSIGNFTANADVIVSPNSGVYVKVEAADNVKVANGGDGEVTDKSDQQISTKPAAKIGDAQYFTLADAITAVKDNQEIKLIADVDKAAGISVPSGKKFTVDFQTHKYAVECPGAGSAATKTSAFQLLQGSTIVFKNGTIECTTANKEKKWSSGDASKGIAMMIQNYANLTLEDMTIDATNIAHNGAAVRYALSNNCGNVQYNGVTNILTADGDYAFDVCKYMDYAAPTVTWNSTGKVIGGIELSGGEFILEQNLEVNQPIKVIALATLDLGTSKLSASSNFTKKKRGVVIVNRCGDLNIKGTTGLIDGSTNAVYAAVAMTEPETCDLSTNLSSKAKLTVQGGTLQGLYYGIVGNGERHNTEITVNGGTIKGVSSNDNVGIYHPQSGDLTINGGVIEGSTGLVLKGGKLVVSGDAEIKGTGTAAIFSHNGSGWNNTGDALAIEVCDYPGQNTPQENLSVAINGGQFTSTSGNAVASYAQDANHTALTGFIHSGTFSDESAIKYAAENANIDIVLESNRDASGIFLGANQNKTITFDLGGKTLNFNGPAVGSKGTENQAFHIEKGNGTFTLKNGKVTIDETVKTSYRFIIQNYNNLVVDGVELDGTNLAVSTGKVNYTVSNNSGIVEFKGKTTIKAATENGIAFDVCKSGSYAEPTVTWNSTGNVNGGIELTGGTFVVAKNLALTRPIRSNSNPAVLTVNSGFVISQENTFPTVKTAKGNDFNENSSGVVIVNYGGNLTINGAGKIEASKNCYAAVSMTEKDEEYSTADSKLTVDGTITLQGDYFGIVGNGNRHHTDIIVKGGTIKGVHENDNIGIFHPQDGKLTISGGEIQGYSSAVEVRSGQVSISDGSLKSTATAYKCTANGSGNTTVGAALAIAQHNTKNIIKVTLSGGTFEGVRAVVLEDPQGNKDADNVSVNITDGKYKATEYAVFNNYPNTTVNISDGRFESTGTSGIAVYARLGSVNITGGSFFNNSNSEATLHVGCPAAKEGNLQPMLTISDVTSCLVKNKATGNYAHNADMLPLAVNMANELDYKAVTITGGCFYGQKPDRDDSWINEGNKIFIDESSVNIVEIPDNGWDVGAPK